jgi:hypothetical protein
MLVLVVIELIVSVGTSRLVLVLVISVEVGGLMEVIEVVAGGVLLVTTHEHADDMREVRPLHRDTNVGSPIVAVCKAAM